MLLGWILIPLAAACKAYKRRKSLYYDYDVMAFTWPIMWIYNNEEDGIDAGSNYWEAKTKFQQIVYWSANRNPTNNLRFVKYLTCDIVPNKVRFIGSFGDGPWSGTKYENIQKYDTKVPQWFFAWQGLYSCFYWQFMLKGKLKRFWIGWKIYPTDIYGVTPYRKYGSGFGLQFKTVT